MTEIKSKRPGPLPKGKKPFVKTSVMVDPAYLEWAKSQPEGLSGMIRECIKSNYDARAPKPKE
jgi:hypothetical protein